MMILSASRRPRPPVMLALVLMAAAVVGCVEQERRSGFGAPNGWNASSNQSRSYDAGLPRLMPDTQRVHTSDMRLKPAVPDIMEHDSDFAGVKRR